MHLFGLVAVAIFGALSVQASRPAPQHDTAAIALMDKLTARSVEKIKAKQQLRDRASEQGSHCTLETARKRMDWYAVVTTLAVRIS
jgi:hypothetical protein